VEDEFGMAFSFSLAAWAVYFRRELGRLKVLGALESGEVYHCQN